jgi:hypothetical protein
MRRLIFLFCPHFTIRFQNACLEALACGLPVITTRDNGFSELIEDGIHGSIVDHAGDIDALRAAILFWSDAVRRKDAVPQILDRAAQFDISKNVDQTLRVLLRRRGPLPRLGRFEKPDPAARSRRSADVRLQTRQRKFSAVSFDVLHSFDQHSESGTVDVTNLAQIDDQLFGFAATIAASEAEMRGDICRSISPSSGKTLSFLVFEAMSALESVEDVIVRGIVNFYQPSVAITSLVSARSLKRKSGLLSASFSREREPVATATVRAPIALPHAMSCSVSPIISTKAGANSHAVCSSARRQATAPS